MHPTETALGSLVVIDDGDGDVLRHVRTMRFYALVCAAAASDVTSH